MNIWNSILDSLKNLNKTRKAPPGLEFISSSGRKVFLIVDESEVREHLIRNSASQKQDYPSFEGKVLKKAENGHDMRQNAKEFETWRELKNRKIYREILAPVYLCTSDGQFLVMEKVKPVEGYSSEASNFADKIQKKVVKDLDIDPGDVDVHGSAIGRKGGEFKIYDYPWISP